MIGEFESNGIIGLAPTTNDKSFIDQLYAQGQATELRVGLNYENPNDKSAVSTITFGAYEWD